LDGTIMAYIQWQFSLPHPFHDEQFFPQVPWIP
jgi:hypothetical protein